MTLLGGFGVNMVGVTGRAVAPPGNDQVLERTASV
jgi:hypothetical protein